MTTTKKTSNPAPLAHRVPAQVSPVITAYAEWLSKETGYKVDPMSVYLGSQLRSTFQKGEANQARLAQAAKDRAARDAEKAQRKAEREAAAAAKAAEPKTTPAPKITTKAQAKVNTVAAMPKRAPRKPASKPAQSAAAPVETAQA